MMEDPINSPRYEFLDPCTSRASIMSKDYLFRAKRASDKVWIFGDLIHSDEKVYIHNGLAGTYYEVDENTIGEHIGFPDCNSNSIFEGDIVYFYDDRELKYVIEYSVRAAAYVARLVGANNDDPRMWSHLVAWPYMEAKVIGNIHDNPELIENK